MGKSSTPGWLVREIESRDGFISIHDYMQVCLYHPEHGYYASGKNFTEKFGADFVTAPLLTPLFGVCVANWVKLAWERTGAPKMFVLAEAGPGDGTLMHNVLNNLPRDVREACEVMMVETSPALMEMQKEKLREVEVTWTEKIPPQKLPLIVFANELLDAFPVHQFEVQNGAWVERGFDAQLQPAFRPAKIDGPVGSGGQILETSPAQTEWLSELKQKAAAALLIDYGYTEGGGDSVQAMQAHQPVPLSASPGEADLTAHVNFAHVASTLGKGCTVTDLAPFLLKSGILAAAEADIHNGETAAALHRLLHPTRMGALFKVAEYFR